MVVPRGERQVNDCNAPAIASANRAGVWSGCPVHHHAAGEILSADGSTRSSTEGSNGWLLPPAGARCGEGPRLILESSSRSILASQGDITLYSLLSESSKRKLFSQLFPRADRAIISRPEAIFRGGSRIMT